MEQPAREPSSDLPQNEWCDIAATALGALRELDFGQIPADPAAWDERLQGALATVTQCAEKAPESAARGANLQLSTEPEVDAYATQEPAAALFTHADEVSLTELIDELDELGMGDQVGRVLLQADRATLRPLDLIPHREGLPPFDLVIAPRTGLVRGATGVFIAATELTLASVQAPIDNHPWRIENRATFANRAELIALLSDYISPSE